MAVVRIYVGRGAYRCYLVSAAEASRQSLSVGVYPFAPGGNGRHFRYQASPITARWQ